MGKLTGNEKIINELKKILKEEVKKATFKFDGDSKPIFDNFYSNVSAKPLRTPNSIELRKWLINELYILHFSYPHIVSTKIYRCLKGMIRKGNLEPAFRFIEKKCNDKTIRERYDNYSKSKCILPFSVCCALCNPINVTTIDINIYDKQNE